jgi:hypothetical protein
MKFAINIPTYYRSDGKSLSYLKTALDSIFNQTHQDFKIFLIGDKYENESEIIDLISTYDSNKLVFENLTYAKERDNYINNKLAIWNYGGVNATNINVDKALNDGYEYICHLDHDDWWLPNHLFEINKCIEETNADWVCTKSTYSSNQNYLPITNNLDEYQTFYPSYAGLIHSSVCMNFKKIPIKYRDLFELNKTIGLPTDGDLWERCRIVIKSLNLKSIFINKLTCRHDEEGFERN